MKDGFGKDKRARYAITIVDQQSGDAGEYSLGSFWNNLLLQSLFDDPYFNDTDRITSTLFYIQKIKPIILKHLADLVL